MFLSSKKYFMDWGEHRVTQSTLRILARLSMLDKEVKTMIVFV